MKAGDLNRYVGKRGEVLFREFITRWCDGKPWFSEDFLGVGAVALDFIVTLIDSTHFRACCWVSVKATRSSKYSGLGAGQKLLVRVTNRDVKRLTKTVFPTYVVGIDIDSKCGFIKRITKAQKKGFVGICTGSRHRLNCRNIKKLWTEVEQFWKGQQPPGTETSVF